MKYLLLLLAMACSKTEVIEEKKCEAPVEKVEMCECPCEV